MDLKQFYDDHDDEFLKFDRVLNQMSSRRDVHAFQLLDILVPVKDDIVSCAEHDQIWLSVDVEELLEAASEEQLLDLHRCGVWYDDDVESLSMWV